MCMYGFECVFTCVFLSVCVFVCVCVCGVCVEGGGVSVCACVYV